MIHTTNYEVQTNCTKENESKFSLSGPSKLEILGRCNICVRNKRTVAYCRQKERHKVPKVAPCVECYKVGIPIVTCRLELKHLGCSVYITETKVNTGSEGETPCVVICEQNDLPQCYKELTSLTFYTPPETDQKQDESIQDYATGYFLDFTEARFSEWMKIFKSQTQTNTVSKGVATRIKNVAMD